MKTSFVLAAIGALAFGWMAVGSAVAAEDPPPYVVKDGKVDKATFNGYRRYGDACARCHGEGADGSSWAPNLLESFQRLDKNAVLDVIVNGRINTASGKENVMPAFGEYQDVVLYLDDIYGYIKARSDGAIPRGRPERWDR